MRCSNSRRTTEVGFLAQDRTSSRRIRVLSFLIVCREFNLSRFRRCEHFRRSGRKKCHNSDVPAPYMDRMDRFVDVHPDQLLGRLTTGLAEEGFDTSPATTFSWKCEITQLQGALRELLELLPAASQWWVLLEYVLPGIGQRVDCVLLAGDVIYVIEYKGGGTATAPAALKQAQEYALNLLDFHEESRGRTAIPIAVGRFKSFIQLDASAKHQGAAVFPEAFSDTILRSFEVWGGRGAAIDARSWNASRYLPVPGIIQAASEVYAGHDIRDLAHNRAGADHLQTTQKALTELVAKAQAEGLKQLIVVTGVPGAGKTLAGLNVVQVLATELNLDKDQASFLSGNKPLVNVLQAALRRSIGARKKGAARSVRSRIREIHRFIKDSDENGHAPADRLIVFDEAQRAWTAAHNLKNFGRDRSEPELVLEIMGRHDGWAVIVALVGGGQEIHTGEAGLAAWGEAIAKHPEWNVITSPEAISGGSSVAGSRLFRDGSSSVKRVEQRSALHLAISKRSYESVVTAAWVNAVLDGKSEEAQRLSTEGLPVYITRDLELARSWLRARAKGDRRAGLIASSGALRLRADGVEAPTYKFLQGIDYVKWFLEPAGDHRSSNQLEVAMSEFEMQGLEVDYVALLWGGDLAFPRGKIVARTLRGVKWCDVSGTGDPQASADDPRTKILNKYRVLLTRFRKAMVIFVPKGASDDSTRSPEDFDSIFDYLVNSGVRTLA